MDKGDLKDTKKAVEDLQAAVGDLEGMVVEAWQGACNDVLEVLTHLGYSVAGIVVVINQVN
jgi:hypothetical protein